MTEGQSLVALEEHSGRMKEPKNLRQAHLNCTGIVIRAQ